MKQAPGRRCDPEPPVERGPADGLRVSLVRRPGADVVRLAGEFDLHHDGVVKRLVDDASRVGHTNVVLDLTEVTFIDASALGAIVHCRSQPRLNAPRRDRVRRDRAIGWGARPRSNEQHTGHRREQIIQSAALAADGRVVRQARWENHPGCSGCPGRSSRGRPEQEIWVSFRSGWSPRCDPWRPPTRKICAGADA